MNQQQVRARRQSQPGITEIFERFWRGELGRYPCRLGLEGEERIPNHFYRKGTAVRAPVNRYERDRQAWAECIATRGTVCLVCDFDWVACMDSLVRALHTPTTSRHWR